MTDVVILKSMFKSMLRGYTLNRFTFFGNAFIPLSYQDCLIPSYNMLFSRPYALPFI